jgi:probable biosynthetic protein (TIGR04098 family)
MDEKRCRLEMPQLAMGGLSEFWLLKEIGRRHWEHVFAHLGVSPTEFCHSDGSRIYPTFARIRFSASKPLRRFQENELLDIASVRFKRAAGYSFSEFEIKSAESHLITTEALSIDARRRGKGNGLARTASQQPPQELLAEPLWVEFDQAKREFAASRDTTGLNGGRKRVHEYIHEINPYYEVNGVNLLYFAAHPIIANLAERDLAKRNHAEYTNWAFTYSTVSCDVFFFRNCNLTDRVRCRIEYSDLDDASWLDQGAVVSRVALHRASDGKLMSVVQTRKEVTQADGGSIAER